MADDIDETLRKLKLQNAELHAADEFAKQLRRHNQTPVVDDDYPMARYAYERALANLLAALKTNGRFGQGNRYGLQDIHAVEQSRAVPNGWRASDDVIDGWVDRHDLHLDRSEARDVFEDARSAHMLAAAPSPEVRS